MKKQLNAEDLVLEKAVPRDATNSVAVYTRVIYKHKKTGKRYYHDTSIFAWDLEELKDNV